MSASGEYSCKKCSRRDSSDNMVCCDFCDAWEHYGCAGVTDSISDSNRSFVCVRCTEEARGSTLNTIPEGEAVMGQGETIPPTETPTTGAIPKNRHLQKDDDAGGSVVSVSTSASSKKSQRIQMCLNLLEETKKVKMRMLEEEEKYLQAKFDLLMKLGEDEDGSKKSSVSARTKRKRLEKWLNDGQEVQDKPASGQVGQVPVAPIVEGLASQEINTTVPTSKTEYVLKSQEHTASAGLVQETSTPLQAGRTLLTDLISPTTIISSPLTGMTQPQQSQVWPLSSGYGRTPGLLHSGHQTHREQSRDKPQFHQSVSIAGTVDMPSASDTGKVPATASVYSQVPLGTVTGAEGEHRAKTALAFASNSTTPHTTAGPTLSNQYIQPTTSLQNTARMTATNSAQFWNAGFPSSRSPLEDCLPRPTLPISTLGVGTSSCLGPLHEWDPSSISASNPVSASNQFVVGRQSSIGQHQIPWSAASHMPGSTFVPTAGSGYGIPPLVSGMSGVPNYPPQPATYGPTGPQIAARQVMPRDLPTFAGDPEDWPIFYSSFRNTTEVCGYSDAENLARLQRCLRGSALDAVRSRLLLPASVPFVMETLRKLYGRPEVLINSLLKKVRNTPSPKADNLHSIVTFGLAVQNLIDHMVISDQQTHLVNPMLLQEFVEKLPTNLKMQWGYFKSTVPNANLETFNVFMSGLVNLASDLSLNTEVSHHSTTKRGDKHKEKLFVHAQEQPGVAAPSTADKKQGHVDKSAVAKVCSYCENMEHQISNCTKFKDLDVDGRWKAIRYKNLCRSCLIPHRKWPCRSNKECGKEGCRIRHHPLLHANPTAPVTSTASTTNRVVEHQNHHFNKSFALFRYVPVTISGNGRQVNIFAFLDEGSSSTLLESSIADQLGVHGPVSSLWLSWTGNITREEKESRCVEVTISGTGQKKKFSIRNVQTVDELQLPKQSFDYECLVQEFPYLKGLPLESYSDVTPRMIIGLEHVRLLTTLKLREGGNTGPVAVKTRLGWCAYGKGLDNKDCQMQQLNLHCSEVATNQSLYDLMKHFFEVEEAVVTRKPEGDEDRRAIEILEKTTIRKQDCFETGLLWRTDCLSLPNSLPMATKRLLALEKRLTRDPELGRKVKEEIAAYEAKHYAHKASKAELEQADPLRVWYLPLGVVVSEKKPGKIRLIWDAAAKAGGVSFNDFLLKGPDLLTSLPDVLLRFRERNIAICGDICEMFHQIRIREQDKQSQRFLWRNGPEEPMQTYIMDVSTFGASCSPCSAQFIKNKNAREFTEVFPRAVDAIIYNHYVDDFLDCTDTEEEAIELVQNVKTIHAAAGFKISKFRSNSDKVLSAIGEPDGCHQKVLCSDKQTTSERVLGLTWIPSSDVFTFDTTALLPRTIQAEGGTPTKRQVLQTVMKLFDPLGLVSHYVVHGKILMQEIWRSGSNWDEPIADHLLDQWHRWIELLGLLSEVQVPRCFFKGASSNLLQSLQLHVLCDASEVSYACVAYLRMDTGNGGRCALVASKTKVAPLKPLSIPRLELQAALIGARLSQRITSALTLSIQKCYFWSDSSTVLSWLRSDARRYHQYVAFRVGEILSITSADDWRHVPSKLNVADEATKWGPGPSFEPESRWFRGPSFLWESEKFWPTEEKQLTTTREELRTAFQHHNCAVEDPLVDASRFSNWNRMVRAIAYFHRAVGIWRKRLTKKTTECSSTK
ncbi:uncharacterized protein LOC134288741 [Aedes albopictus]|uniref:PHD-type domain-containing protein n=1 Tax=Aedes albopictus TaxID=7160 RepID=A0ABM1XXU4_AEDAL